MIFVTVGMQLPFDRLLQAVDEIAPRLGKRVVAQTSNNSYVPKNIEWQPFIRPLEVDRYFQEADVIVAHAGIGTVLTAQKLGKPVVIMPRKASFGEHRNDHQLATVSQLEGRPGIYVVRDAEALYKILNQPLAGPGDDSAVEVGRQRLRAYLDGVIGHTFAGGGRR
jgi:UDP-N-acetylglucosamine transferase subunit ALG13